MVKNAILFAAIVATLTFVAPTIDAEPKCWICAGSDNGAKCHDQSIPNFSMARCELRCFYFLTEICFCRTYGDTCAIEPGPGAAVDGGLVSGAEGSARYSLTPKTRESLRRQVGPIVAGFLDWDIPATMEGPGPHRIEGVMSEGSTSYDYAGEITFAYGSAVIRYELDDHPEIRTVDAQFGVRGYGGSVIVQRADGERRQYDMFEDTE